MKYLKKFKSLQDANTQGGGGNGLDSPHIDIIEGMDVVNYMVTDTETFKAEFDESGKIHKKKSVFTVNSFGKKVIFSPGNLYWDGSEFKFEEHQYDFPTEWNPNHVGYFFWSKDINVAISETYYDEEVSDEDKLFAINGGAIDGWSVLSGEEWQYLCDNAVYMNSEGMYSVWIEDTPCIIFKPDGFDGRIEDYYTLSEWIEAETSGLVAVPFTYYRYYSSDIIPDNNNLRVWCNDTDTVYEAKILGSDGETNIGVYNIDRGIGYPIRLVQVVE